MSQDSSSSPPPIPCDRSSPEPLSHIENPNPNTATDDLIAENEPTTTTTTTNTEQPTTRRNRPSRACTIRAAERLLAAQSVVERKPKPKKEQQEEESPQQQQCSKIVTPLVEEPSPSQLPRWSLRSKWELASVLNFLHVSFGGVRSSWPKFASCCVWDLNFFFCELQVFRPLLNIHNEFTVEEFETALITPNDTLSDIHIPLLKVGTWIWTAKFVLSLWFCVTSLIEKSNGFVNNVVPYPHFVSRFFALGAHHCSLTYFSVAPLIVIWMLSFYLTISS